MIMVKISLAVCVVLILATAFFAWKKQPPRQEGECLRVKSVPETGIMAAMLLAVGLALNIVKLVVPETAGTDSGSYTFIAIFAIICTTAGCHILLTAFVKQVVVCQDCFWVYTPFGAGLEIRWQDIIEVKSQLMSKSISFKTQSSSASVNGRNKEYLMFLKLAKERVPRAVGSDELGKLYQRYSGGR